MAAIELRGVSKSFGSTRVLDGIDLTCESGELVVVVGPSGSGKSTLLRIVAGLEQPDSGSVTVDGIPVDSATPWTTGVSMVFEEDALYEHMTVSGNLSFPQLVAGTSRSEAGEVAEKEATRLGIRRLLSRKPSSLSGGERGLTATGRALTRKTIKALLLDEPMAKADVAMRRRFRAELLRIQREEGVTALMATNDQEEALSLADRLVVLIDGRVAQVAPPLEVFEHPASATVASFIGPVPMNLLPAKIERSADGWSAVVGVERVALDVKLPDALDGRRVTLGLHPHELEVAPESTPFSRTLTVCVGQVEDLGGTMLVRFGLGRAPGTAFIWKENRPAAVRPGDRRELTWIPDRLRIFDAATGETIPSRGGLEKPPQ